MRLCLWETVSKHLNACRVPAPQMSPETSGKKRRPITANAQIWEVHLNLEKFRARLSSKKESKGDERWRLSFKNKLPSYSHAFVLETALTISFNKLPRSFNLFNGSRLYYGTIKCEISSAFCSVTTYNPAVALTTEKLYEQMTSNQASTKRNVQNANAYLLNILVQR